MSSLRRLVWEIWLPVLLLVVWFFASLGSESFYWPPLAEILSDFRRLWVFDHLLTDALPTIVRLTIGFGIAFIVGVGIGLLLGTNPALETATRPVIEFVRATPGIAMLPIIMVVLGTGDAMKVFTIALVSCWPILLNTIDGVRAVEPVLVDVARSYQLTRVSRIRDIVLPSAAPQILAGGRTALGVAVVVTVVTEMVGAPGGIGYFILDSQRSFDISEMWTGVFVLGIIGYAVNKGFELAESRVLRWHRGMLQHHEGHK
ncbi:ABC transporter permease [Granulicoccus sp. GXG6511]|uniref:ABC transporter permease n=1 Tax=Granulicoccus sp. GXG6511 TaxID=3381351 RepID=UPI003D7E53F5